MERYYQRERQLMELDDEHERLMERYFEHRRFMELYYELERQDMEREREHERLMA